MGSFNTKRVIYYIFIILIGLSECIKGIWYKRDLQLNILLFGLQEQNRTENYNLNIVHNHNSI